MNSVMRRTGTYFDCSKAWLLADHRARAEHHRAGAGERAQAIDRNGLIDHAVEHALLRVVHVPARHHAGGVDQRRLDAGGRLPNPAPLVGAGIDAGDETARRDLDRVPVTGSVERR